MPYYTSNTDYTSKKIETKSGNIPMIFARKIVVDPHNEYLFPLSPRYKKFA